MLTLTADELRDLTGYAQPCRQIEELHRQGFHRARRSRIDGRVILERAHYDAVCAGLEQAPAPKLRQPRLRQAA
jgi:hypothetical protein